MKKKMIMAAVAAAVLAQSTPSFANNTTLPTTQGVCAAIQSLNHNWHC